MMLGFYVRVLPVKVLAILVVLLFQLDFLLTALSVSAT